MRQNGEKSAAKAPFGTFLQPLHYDLRLLAAKGSSIRSRGGEEPQHSHSTIELRTTVAQIAAPKPDLDAKAEKRRF